MDLRYFMDRIRDVKIKDLISFFPMSFALLFRPFYRKKYEKVWLICEEPAEARDNGYHFFKYMREEHPEQAVVYAIKRKSVDYAKVARLGDVVEHGSVKHWLMYFLGEYNISSQKGGKPNAAVCSFMELNGCFKPQNIFLQHGVTINNVKWLYKDKSVIDMFITSTEPETKFVQENFGYKKEVVQLTGFPRFDALHNIRVNDRQIVIMPTWRYWFNLNSKKKGDTDDCFEQSEYLEKWLQLMDNTQLVEMINKYKLNVIFYLHRNLQNHMKEFERIKNHITLASWKEYDIQTVLKESALLITDYSSVFFDMVYMKKPVIFYQFDEEKYRRYQYEEGYFDYHNNPFGESFPDSDHVLTCLEESIKNNFKVDHKFLQEHENIFIYYDDKNSERIYKRLLGKRKMEI